MIAQHELAFVVRAPEHVRAGRPRQLGPPGHMAPAPPLMDQAVPVEHGVDRADGGQVRRARLPPQLLADLGGSPPGVLPLQPHDDRFQLRRQSIRLTVGPSTSIAERGHAAILVALKNLVAGLPGNPERRAQGRHLFALQQPRHELQPFVHDLTLLPRHAPLPEEGRKCHPCVRNTVLPISQEGPKANRINNLIGALLCMVLKPWILEQLMLRGGPRWTILEPAKACGGAARYMRAGPLGERLALP